MLARSELTRLYVEKGLSVSDAAKILGVSQGKFNYWLAKHGIRKRTIREAGYRLWNPTGDPFRTSDPVTMAGAFLYGLGIGLYWGEGTKRSRNSVRLGNSDPALIRAFIAFLETVFEIDTRRLRCALQVFGDMDPAAEMRFWSSELGIPLSRFYAPVITPHRGVGTYRHKTKHGVLTIYFNNTRLRDILVGTIEKLSDGEAEIAQLVEHVLGGTLCPAHPQRRREDESRITVNLLSQDKTVAARKSGPND